MNESREQLVSIGLPTYNGANRIGKIIDLFLAQSYQNFELIISDNASTDDTRRICEGYARKDARVRYIRQKDSIGMIGNFDLVFRQAKGKYFMWAGDDDWYDPDFVTVLKRSLDENSDYGVAMSSLRRVFDDGQVQNEIIYAGKNNITDFSSKQIFDAAIRENPVYFFVVGLWRIDILGRLLSRPWPDVLGPDILLICEASFMTRLYSVSQILYEKTIYRVNKSERYSEDYKKHYTKKFVTEWVKVAFKRLLSSPNISIYRKLFILPSRLFLILWVQKRALLRESFPFLMKQQNL